MNIVKILNNYNLTISVCESFTGGYIASSIIRYKGASLCFKLGVISYDTKQKIDKLHVNIDTINKYTLASNEVSLEMAKGLKDIVQSDIYISSTGVASGTNYGHKCGSSFFTIIYKDKIFNFYKKFNGTRLYNIKKATKYILKKLKDIIDKYENNRR